MKKIIIALVREALEALLAELLKKYKGQITTYVTDKTKSPEIAEGVDELLTDIINELEK